jgi:23S rRNA maturation-related 3'-5' exoribonuclease YhaM
VAGNESANQLQTQNLGKSKRRRRVKAMKPQKKHADVKKKDDDCAEGKKDKAFKRIVRDDGRKINSS